LAEKLHIRRPLLSTGAEVSAEVGT
jgi:hypothetical protein